MLLSTCLLFILSLIHTVASPHPQNQGGTSSRCGQYDTQQLGGYALQNNQWGLATKGSSSQNHECAHFTSYNASSNAIGWTTDWFWDGPGTVKSYTNVQPSSLATRAIEDYTALQTSWHWSYALPSQVMANVAYDMFLGDSVNAAHRYEVMVWLDRINQWPSTNLTPLTDSGSPIARVTVDGRQWDLWQGKNEGFIGYTFTAPTPITAFDGDLLPFLALLVQHYAVSPALVLQAVQAGTEAFLGSGFLTAEYSLAVH